MERGRFLFLVVVLTLVKDCRSQTTDMTTHTSLDKPCGDFPWDPDDVTVQCDYSYYRSLSHGREYRGRCTVTCPMDADMLIGPLEANYLDVAYYCYANNGTWLGTEPVCLGDYDNSTLVTDETNGIRLVGGEFYGCVELYDDVTQQWGPVRGWQMLVGWKHTHEEKMGWADLACKTLGFPGVLATTAFRLVNGTIYDFYYSDLSLRYEPTYPSDAPKFVVSSDLPNSTLRDGIDYVVRGPCNATDWDCKNDPMCVACAGQQKHDIDVAQDIGAEVTCTSDFLVVSFHRPADGSIQKEDVQLAAPPCTAEENSTHIYIQAPLTECGTSRQDTEDEIVYSNTLTINVNSSGAIITRHYFMEISVECRLPRRKTLTVNFNPETSSVYKSNIVGRGEFVISMELYLSNSFRVAVSDFPLSMELGQMLYVQLQVTSGDTNLQVFADNCMATPTASPDDSVLYYLIQEGCDQDSTVAHYWSPSTMEERFGFQAFAFTSGAREVYLHCDVLLCDVTDPGSRCAQGCQSARRRRDAEGDSEVYLLIQGPIVLNDGQVARDNASTRQAVHSCLIFLGACAVLVVAMFVDT